jgi:hypothetical protein
MLGVVAKPARTGATWGSMSEMLRCNGARGQSKIYTEICMDASMKTTLDLDDELLVKAKALSAREKKSLTSLIEEGLRLRLRSQMPKQALQRKRRLPVYKGRGGVAAGVDPTSNRAMFDAAGDES